MKEFVSLMILTVMAAFAAVFVVELIDAVYTVLIKAEKDSEDEE